MKGKIHLNKKQKLMIMVSAGVLLLLIFIPSGTQEQTETVSDSPEAAAAEQTLEVFIKMQEKRLKSVVEKIAGAGDVYVMITAKTSVEQVVEKDQAKSEDKVSETDAGGGRRDSSNISISESTLYDNQTGSPYVVKEIQPEIKGVVVAASGADDLSVVKEITDTVAVLFEIPVNKIKVVKME